MIESPRKKSPRAPSIDLKDALERTGKAYDSERLHAAPVDVVAQNLGYRGSNNGAAMSALASLRYYGLVERPREGVLAVAKDYENFRFAPDAGSKRSFVQKFFRSPPLFKELLEQYESGFPSDATLKYELIQRGFLPQSAATLVAVLRRSIDYINAEFPYEEKSTAAEVGDGPSETEGVLQETPLRQPTDVDALADQSAIVVNSTGDHDRIPVRLPGNRRAWLVIPTPFFSADKKRIKAQIDLLLTEDDEGE